MKANDVFLLVVAIVIFALFVWGEIKSKQQPENIPHQFTYTVIDAQGDTITGETWVPSSTLRLEIKRVGGAPCLVAVDRKPSQDVIICDVKQLLRFTRFRNLLETR